jgi:hypothetical protein
MIALLCFALNLVASFFKSRGQLEAEKAALRQQLIVLQVRGRGEFTNSDRLFFIQLYRWFPSILKAVMIIRPETLVRWHRAGFRRYWRWKSRNLGGRPPIDAGLRALIRRMSLENWLWGAPRIHGELLKLGFALAQSTVAKYMTSPDNRLSGQRWGTFVRNHLPQIAAMDLFVVPTISFERDFRHLVELPLPPGGFRSTSPPRAWHPDEAWPRTQRSRAFLRYVLLRLSRPRRRFPGSVRGALLTFQKHQWMRPTKGVRKGAA